jgi:hypothetical protein
MSKDLEGTCGACESRKDAPREKMNVPERQVYKGRVLRCGNPNSKHYNHLVRPGETCEEYGART